MKLFLLIHIVAISLVYIGCSSSHRTMEDVLNIRYERNSSLPSWVHAPEDSFTVYVDYDHWIVNKQSQIHEPMVHVYFVNKTAKEQALGDVFDDMNIEAETKPGFWEHVIPYYEMIIEFPPQMTVPANHFYEEPFKYFNSGTRYRIRYMFGHHVSNLGWGSIPDSLLEETQYDDLTLRQCDSMHLVKVLDGTTSLPTRHRGPLGMIAQREKLQTIALRLVQRFPGRSTSALLRNVLADTTRSLDFRDAAVRAIEEDRDPLAAPVLVDILLHQAIPQHDSANYFRALTKVSSENAVGIVPILMADASPETRKWLWVGLEDAIARHRDLVRDSSLFKFVQEHRYDLESKAMHSIIWCYSFFNPPDLADYLSLIWENNSLDSNVREDAKERYGIYIKNRIYESSLTVADSSFPENGQLHFRWSIRNISDHNIDINTDSLRFIFMPRIFVRIHDRDSIFTAFAIDSSSRHGMITIHPTEIWSGSIVIPIGILPENLQNVSIAKWGSRCWLPSLYPLPTIVTDPGKAQVLARKRK
jgi:hypothetical protein